LGPSRRSVDQTVRLEERRKGNEKRNIAEGRGRDRRWGNGMAISVGLPAAGASIVDRVQDNPYRDGTMASAQRRRYKPKPEQICWGLGRTSALRPIARCHAGPRRRSPRGGGSVAAARPVPFLYPRRERVRRIQSVAPAAIGSCCRHRLSIEARDETRRFLCVRLGGTLGGSLRSSASRWVS
jgi:hypothetical protein